MTATPFLSRRERFASVGSTNDTIRSWLEAGTPEVCLAVADEQTAGRGREGRTWTAPPGAGLLLSLGFRPTWLEPERTWRLAAIVALAMAEAAETAAGLTPGSIRLKWPNDLVVEDTAVRKLAGLLGETVGLGTDDPRAIVGIGLNADWQRAEFPPGLAEGMTSLREWSRATDRSIQASSSRRSWPDSRHARSTSARADSTSTPGWIARSPAGARCASGPRTAVRATSEQLVSIPRAAG